MLPVKAVDGNGRRGNVVDFEAGHRHRGTQGLLAEIQEIQVQAPVGSIDRETAGEILRPVTAQRRGIDATAPAVPVFEPDDAPQPLLVPVERVDEVFEPQFVLAGLHIDGDPQARRIAQRPHADQRIGIDRTRESTAGHVVDRIEHGNLTVVKFTLGFEFIDRHLDDVAQTGALALRNVPDRIVDITGRIAIAGKDRFVDVQRVDIDPHVADIGVREEGVVEDLRQFLIGDNLVAGTGGACKQQERAERYTENAFHNQALCFTMLRTVMFEIT